MIKLHTPEQLGISNYPISPLSYTRSFEEAMAKCPGRLVSVFPVAIGGTSQLFLVVEYPDPVAPKVPKSTKPTANVGT